MIKVDDCLLSEDIVEKEFACNIHACKGICCIEGDAGAPLDQDEIAIIESHLEKIKPYMDATGLATLEALGFHEQDPFDEAVTTCKANKECVFVTSENGILSCAIEQANVKEKFGFQKPISCHLYPIRAHKYTEFHALNYHKWSICSDACQKGKEDGVRGFEFAKSALVRKFGEEWYTKLELAAAEYEASKK